MKRVEIQLMEMVPYLLLSLSRTREAHSHLEERGTLKQQVVQGNTRVEPIHPR